jgi:hypothetical protein
VIDRPVASPDRRGERETRWEQRESAVRGLLVRGQQPVARVDGVAQGRHLVRSGSAATGRPQGNRAVHDRAGDLEELEEPGPRGGQLDRQREAVGGSADARDLSAVRAGQVDLVPEPVEEQRHGGAGHQVGRAVAPGQLERLEAIRLLALQPERSTARREQPNLRRHVQE